MISTLKNLDGYPIAYLEWEIVNVQGQFEENGEYCYIQNYWIHPIWRSENRLILFELSHQINDHKFSKNMKWIYWRRYKYNERLSKLYPKERFLKGDNYGWKKEQFAAGRTG